MCKRMIAEAIAAQGGLGHSLTWNRWCGKCAQIGKGLQGGTHATICPKVTSKGGWTSHAESECWNVSPKDKPESGEKEKNWKDEAAKKRFKASEETTRKRKSGELEGRVEEDNGDELEEMIAEANEEAKKKMERKKAKEIAKAAGKKLGKELKKSPEISWTSQRRGRSEKK